jgi:hypothetical protein
MANQSMRADIYVVFVAKRESRERFSRLKGSGSENFRSSRKYRRQNCVAQAGFLANPHAIRRGLAVRPATAPARLPPYSACALEHLVSAAFGSAG